MAQSENRWRLDNADRAVNGEGGRTPCNRNWIKPLFLSAGFCAFVLATVVPLMMTHALVIGHDDRVELADHEREEFKAVGLIASGDLPRGTAFLVCDCFTIVTAAHLALDVHGRAADEEIEFLHEGHNGAPHLLERATISTTHVAKNGSYDPQTDWLIARLSRAVPNCRSLQYEKSNRVETWKKVSMIGFHADVAGKRISKHCSTSPVLSHKGLLVHMCDAGAGSSGSPLLIVDESDLNHRAHVVAIQSGAENYLGFNVAVLFSAEFEQTLEQFVTPCDATPKIVAQRHRT